MENKIVIYTAITGGYDHLLQPKVLDDRFDYVCFMDEVKTDRIGAWSIRKIDFNHKDKTRIARFVKLNPQLVLPEYAYSLWIDANVTISQDYIYERILSLIGEGVKLASIKHWGRNCLYEEAKVCLAANKDSIYKILQSMVFLKKNRYPTNNGLCETNVVFRNHSSKCIIKFNELWWKLLNKYSKRDQLGFNFCLWKLGVDVNYFLENGYTARNHFAFEYVKHPDKKLTTREKLNLSVRTNLVRIVKKISK